MVYGLGKLKDCGKVEKASTSLWYLQVYGVPWDLVLVVVVGLKMTDLTVSIHFDNLLTTFSLLFVVNNLYRQITSIRDRYYKLIGT